MSKVNFTKTAELGAKAKSGSRHMRRAAEAKARKEMEGKTIPQLKKILRRKKKK